MKGFVVKITSWKWWLDLVCPPSCRGCGALGTVLCGCCKNNILDERVRVCPMCKRRLEAGERVCAECELGFERLEVVGWREGVLKEMIEEYKYRGVRELAGVLAELAVEVMQEGEGGADDEQGRVVEQGGERERVVEHEGGVRERVVVVPLPTIGRHVRQRGLDHTGRLAREVARRMGWECRRVLGRAKDTVQVGAKKAVREEQAKRAYEVSGKVEAGEAYLLVDDVWTTGASMRAAAEVMRAAGATRLMGVVLATGRPKTEGAADGEDGVVKDGGGEAVEVAQKAQK